MYKWIYIYIQDVNVEKKWGGKRERERERERDVFNIVWERRGSPPTLTNCIRKKI